MTVLFTDTEAESWAQNANVWARQLDGIDASLKDASAHLQWTGARYLDFQGRMVGTCDAIERAYARMLRAATLLAQVADHVKVERSRLWQDENLVVDIVNGEPHPVAFLRRCGYTADYYPMSYDTEWAELKKKVVALAERQHHTPTVTI